MENCKNITTTNEDDCSTQNIKTTSTTSLTRNSDDQNIATGTRNDNSGQNISRNAFLPDDTERRDGPGGQ